MHGLTRFAVANKFRIIASVSPKNLEKISGLNEADELDIQEKQHSVKHRAMQSWELIYPFTLMTFIVDWDASACTNNDFPHPMKATVNDMYHTMYAKKAKSIVPDGP